MSHPSPKIPPLSVTHAQRAVPQQAVLEGWLGRRTTAQALTQRSLIVLECAEGHSNMEVSRRLRITPNTVRIWRHRYSNAAWTTCAKIRVPLPPPGRGSQSAASA